MFGCALLISCTSVVLLMHDVLCVVLCGADKSSDEVWGIVQKFSEQDCNSLEDVIAVKDIFDLKCLKNEMGISAGICGKIVKSLSDLAMTPPPPPSPTLKHSTSSSTLKPPSPSVYSISGFEIILNETIRAVGGIKFGYFVDISGEKTEVVLKFSDTGHDNCCRNIKREAEILANLKPLGCVVKILGTDPFEHLPHYIVLKHAGRSLDTYMLNGNYEIRKSFIPKILVAILSIHNAGYVHNDVKPSNILIHYNADTGMNSVIICDFDQSCKLYENITSSAFTPGWCGLGARVFPRVASDREDVFAVGLVCGKLTNEYCNSRSVFPDNPRESSVLLTDQQELCKALSVTGAGKEIIEDMLKLIPEERPSIQEAYKRYQQLTATKLDEDKKQIKGKLAQSEKDKAFLQDQVIENFSDIEITLEKNQRLVADNFANILKGAK